MNSAIASTIRHIKEERPALGSKESPYVIGEEVARRILENSGQGKRRFFRHFERIEAGGTYYTVYTR